MELDWTAWLNVAVTAVAMPTPLAPGPGVSAVTVGPDAVVNDQMNGIPIVWPDGSLSPLIVAV